MLQIADTRFSSRLLTGTGKFATAELMQAALQASGSQLVTLAMKRVDLKTGNDAIFAPLKQLGVKLLPNTSGAKTADEAVFAARLAHEALGTYWLKLEIHPDAKYLLPDPIETLRAAERLVKEGFVVLPYCGADPVLCKRLEEASCAAVMPLPIRGCKPAISCASLLNRLRYPSWLMLVLVHRAMPLRRWRWGPMRCWLTRPLPWRATQCRWPTPFV